MVFMGQRLLIRLIAVSLILFSQSQAYGLEKDLRSIFEQQKLSAVGIAVVENDRVLYVGGFGTHGLNDLRPITKDSLFRVGSITKSFTGLAALKAQEKQLFELDSLVIETLPDIPLKNRWPDSPISFRMMLEHTAGLQDLSEKEFAFNKPITLEAAFQIAPHSRVSKWEPGLHNSYTNAGAGYVALAIERAAKENYDTWFQREILNNLGMKSSTLVWSPTLQKQLVVGYNTDKKTEIPYWHTLFRSFGGLNSTPEDMARFLMLLTSEGKLDDSQLWSRAQMQEFEAPQTSLMAARGIDFGYALGVRSSLYKGHKIFSHNGDADGYLARYAYNKEAKRAYFVVINAFDATALRAFSSYLDNWLITRLKASTASVRTDSDLPAKHSILGRYCAATQRFPWSKKDQLSVYIKNDRMYRSFAGAVKGRQIMQTGDDTFTYANENFEGMVFVPGYKGQDFFIGPFGSYSKKSGETNSDCTN